MIYQAASRRAGKGLFERLQWSFGDKQAQGFTYQGTTKKYSVLTGARLDSRILVSCIAESASELRPCCPYF